MHDIRENEHQELFTLGIDPRAPIAIHIPSPLGRLGYFVFVRVAREAVERLAGTGAHLVVGGLRPDDVTIEPGAGVPGDAVIPSADPACAWRCIGRADVSRGDGTLTFQNWPADVAQAELLLCTWPRFVTSGMADTWIAAQADPHWAPTGVPLGGIGGGRVDLCRDGRFRNFSLNNNQDAHLEEPDGLAGAYLAVTVDGRTIDLATRPIAPGHEACARLDFIPRFPQAILSAPAIVPDLDVTVTASGSLCPQDLRRSSIPGFVLRWEVRNTGTAAQTITCAMGWPNVIGVGGGIGRAETSIGYGDGYYHHWDDPAGRAEAVVPTADGVAVRFTGMPSATHQASAGEHWLGVLAPRGAGAGSAGDGQGEVRDTVTLAPGETAVLTMALVAAMPHWIDSKGDDRGHFWQNHFADGPAMLTAVLTEADAILTDAGALAQLLAQSSLSELLQARLSNCTYPLVTNSVWYRDGRFSINEGPTEMAGTYGTIDQRLAAHPATQLLFPQLNELELSLFAAIQGEDGGIQHDLGGGHLERGPGSIAWPDLTCSFIIQTARHAWSTGDAAFGRAMWPRAKRALLRHAEWAEAGGGVAQVGNGLGTSYDGYHYYGTTAYMGTLWLAALTVMTRWAAQEGDDELLAAIPAWRTAALARLEADIWNGRCFDAYGNTEGVRRETCHAGQLAGQVYTRLLTGTDVLDEWQVRSCLDALFALNGHPRFGIPPDEVAYDGTAGAEFGWLPYVEGFMLTAAATLADPRLLPVWERMLRAMDDAGRHVCDTRLMYRPSTGEPSWGAFYMTAPASWLVYDALLDFWYEPAAGSLRLRTTHPGRYPLVHPLWWGRADITADGAVTLTVERVWSETPLVLAALDVEDGRTVTMAGSELPVEQVAGNYVRASFAEPVALEAGLTLGWQVR
jgi:non-lysosomal glucosylceramidase